jgi:hypothetical protein
VNSAATPANSTLTPSATVSATFSPAFSATYLASALALMGVEASVMFRETVATTCQWQGSLSERSSWKAGKAGSAGS